MGKVMDGVNGFTQLFRLVTPALLSVLIWIVISSQERQERELTLIRGDVLTMKNDYFHQFSDIKERLKAVETELKLKRKG